MIVSISWESETVTPESIRGELKALGVKSFTDTFSRLDKGFRSLVMGGKQYCGREIVFEMPNLFVAMRTSDRIFYLLRKRSVDDSGLNRTFWSEKSAEHAEYKDEFCQVLHRLDNAEKAIRSAVAAIKKTRSQRMPVPLGTKLKNIRLGLQGALPGVVTLDL